MTPEPRTPEEPEAPRGRGWRRAGLSSVVAGGLVLLGLGLSGFGHLDGELERASREAPRAQSPDMSTTVLPVGFYGPSLAERRSCAPAPAPPPTMAL